MKQILITHTDLDGAGCAILFKKYLPSIEIEYHNYDTIDEIAKKLWDNKDDYATIYFADITPSEEVGRQMIDDPKFTLIDHHETRTYLEDTPWFTTRRSATYISHSYLANSLVSDGIPIFINGVNAYDMWELDSEYRELGLDLNILFDYYGMDEFVYQFSNMHTPYKHEQIIIDVLRTMETRFIDKKLKQGKIEIDEYDNTYFSVYIDQTRGNLGSIVEHPDFPQECLYAKCVFINDGKVSLYSNKIDVSKICESRGGGGHPGAAGYPL